MWLIAAIEDGRNSAMSKETEKLFKEFHKYLEEHSDDDLTEE